MTRWRPLVTLALLLATLAINVLTYRALRENARLEHQMHQRTDERLQRLERRVLHEPH